MTYVEEANRANGSYYYLVSVDNGSKETQYSYGKEKPTFYEPEFHHGVCENKLGDIPTGSVDLLIDDPPYGTTDAMWDTEPDWEEMTERYGRILADDGLLVVFGKQPSLMPVYNAFTNDGATATLAAWRITDADALWGARRAMGPQVTLPMAVALAQ